MLDLDMIESTIKELEDSETNFSNCQRLASLIMLRDYYKSNVPITSDSNDNVIKEYNDILNSYNNYCSLKRKYQLKEINGSYIEEAIQTLCKDIREFVEILYSLTDMPYERQELNNMIVELEALI